MLAVRNLVQRCYQQVHCLHSMARNLSSLSAGCQKIPNPSSRLPSGIFNSVLDSPVNSSCLNLPNTRSYMRVYYKPSAWKRYNKHNIEKRLTTPGGLDVLWKRVLKGRHSLAAYERILPNTIDSKILAKHQTRFRNHPLTKKKLPKPGLF